MIGSPRPVWTDSEEIAQTGGSPCGATALHAGAGGVHPPAWNLATESSSPIGVRTRPDTRDASRTTSWNGSAPARCSWTSRSLSSSGSSFARVRSPSCI